MSGAEVFDGFKSELPFCWVAVLIRTVVYLSSSSLTAWPDTNPGNAYVSATHIYFTLDVGENSSSSNERFNDIKLLLSPVSLKNNGIQSINK